MLNNASRSTQNEMSRIESKVCFIIHVNDSSGVRLFGTRLGDRSLEDSAESDLLREPSLSWPLMSPSSSRIFFSLAASCSFSFCCTWIWISRAVFSSFSGVSARVSFGGVLLRDHDRRDRRFLLLPSSVDQPEPLLDRFRLVDGGGLFVSPSRNVVTSFVLERLFVLRLYSRDRDFERDFDLRERSRDLLDESRVRLLLREYERLRR